jgi:hypothetical protein
MVLHRPVELAAPTGHLDFWSATEMTLHPVADEPDYLGAPWVTSALFVHSGAIIIHEILA